MAQDARPLVVPLDGSTNAEAAFPIALHVARSFGIPLRCLRVESRTGDQDDGDRRGREFESYVAGLLNLHGGSGIEWSAPVLEGDPAEMILAESQQARLIVLGSHGHGGVRSAFSGSVADRIVRASTVPVLVVSVNGQHRLTEGPILVGLDGSQVSEAGLAAGRELAAATGLPLVLLQAWEPVPPPAIEFVPNADRIAREHAAAADAYVESMHQPGEEFVAMSGPALAAIRQAADRLDASVVVLTSQGKGFGARLALGSTTEAVRHSLSRPILIVPVHVGRDGREPGGSTAPAKAHQ